MSKGPPTLAATVDMSWPLVQELRFRRLSLYWTQLDVIKASPGGTKFVRNSISNWERGTHAMPLEGFVAIADALGLEVRLVEKGTPK